MNIGSSHQVIVCVSAIRKKTPECIDPLDFDGVNCKYSGNINQEKYNEVWNCLFCNIVSYHSVLYASTEKSTSLYYTLLYFIISRFLNTMDETNLTLIVMPGPSSGAVLSLKISPISGVSKAGCVFAQVQHHPNPPGVPTTPGDDRRSRYFPVTTSPALPISGM